MNTYKFDYVIKDTVTNTTRWPTDLGDGYDWKVINLSLVTAVRIVVYTGTTLDNAIFKPMLEAVNVITEFEPYWEQIHTLNLGTTELCAIKDTNGNVVAKDIQVYRNAKWQFDKIIKKLVLNGIENWVQTTAYEGFYRYSLEVNDNDLVYSSSVTVHGVNSHFNQRINQGHGGYEYLYVQGTPRGGTIYIQIKNIDTVEKLKTFLAEQYSNNIPVTIYFVSKNHLYIDCTAEQSEVLDKLYNNFTLQKGTNNIIVESSNGVGVNLELEYMQDNILKDKKLENRVTALENLLSTTQTSALLLDNLQNDLESEVN